MINQPALEKIISENLPAIRVAKSRRANSLTDSEQGTITATLVEALVMGESDFVESSETEIKQSNLWWGIDPVNAVTYSDPKKSEIRATWITDNQIPKEKVIVTKLTQGAQGATLYTAALSLSDRQELLVVHSSKLSDYNYREDGEGGLAEIPEDEREEEVA